AETSFAGEIEIKASIHSLETNDKGQTFEQIDKNSYLLIEIHDTGIGFSQVDSSITRRQDGIGLGLSICKNLVSINGGEINAESQLGKGSKFWFTWNIGLLSSSSTTQFPFNSLSHSVKLKRMLIVHPVESARSAMVKYLECVGKVDAFDTFDKSIQEMKNYKKLYNQSAYDIVLIRLYEKNKEEVIKTVREINLCSSDLLITFIVPSGHRGKDLAERVIRKVEGQTAIIYTPITWKKLISQLSNLSNTCNNIIDKNFLGESISEITNTLKRIDENLDLFENENKNDSKSRSRSVSKSKCILCVDNNSTDLNNTLQQLSEFGYSTIFATNGQEAIDIMKSESELSNIIKPCRISLILTECNL
ncbi:617_t:CDS:2, partial [Racocetra persica]